MLKTTIHRLLRRLTPFALLCVAARPVAAQPQRLQRTLGQADGETRREPELVRS